MFLTLIALLMILTMMMMMVDDPHLNTCVDQTAVVGLQLDVNLKRQRGLDKWFKGSPKWFGVCITLYDEYERVIIIILVLSNLWIKERL